MSSMPAQTFFSRIKHLLLLEKPWFSKVVKTFWILFVTGFLSFILYIYLVIQNPYNWFGGMPDLRAIENPENDLSSEVISADGVSLGRYFRYNRSQIRYDELPPMLVKTLVISEDHRFFEHSGMDLRSYLR